MHYTVAPGLYALGTPDETSPVFVTANYKLSFDKLRSALPGRDAWILVLDTKGINVWCAAGKGSFGTQELVRRVAASRLDALVSHRNLILPQLGAPGTAAHAVKKQSGFSVVYGPVRAEDLPAFMDAGMKATPQMRIKDFSIGERAVLIPMELIPSMKWGVILLTATLLIGSFGNPVHGVFAMLMMLFGIMAGAVLTPLLLPWLPGRALSVKAATAGLVASGMLLVSQPVFQTGAVPFAAPLGLLIMATALSAFIGMNFTGATTYTSLSGVRKEMKWAVPVIIGAGVIGLALWIGALAVM